jgi:CBS domain containing-hemolysin-like protein
MPFDEMLNIFKHGGGYLALVQRVTGKGTSEQRHEMLGVCTLEDLIEELIGRDNVDETDVNTDNVARKCVLRMWPVDAELLKMFDPKTPEESLCV